LWSEAAQFGFTRGVVVFQAWLKIEFASIVLRLFEVKSGGWRSAAP
jgi:hypothetical protein